MCFHISITKKRSEIENRFNTVFDYPETYEPYYHFNGWETKNLYIIRQDDNLIENALWGALPTHFDLSERSNFLRKSNTLNATKERLFESPLFSQLIQWQKCIIIADGLYEPHKVDGVKGSFPYYFKLKSNEPFAFAGIYSVIDDGINPLYSASIITTEANELFKKIHNSPNKQGSYRMPLILNQDDENDWLNSHNLDDIKTLLHVKSKHEFEAYPVSKDVFSNKIDSNREDILNEIKYKELII